MDELVARVQMAVPGGPREVDLPAAWPSALTARRSRRSCASWARSVSNEHFIVARTFSLQQPALRRLLDDVRPPDFADLGPAWLNQSDPPLYLDYSDGTTLTDPSMPERHAMVITNTQGLEDLSVTFMPGSARWLRRHRRPTRRQRARRRRGSGAARGVKSRPAAGPRRWAKVVSAPGP
jgi:hypothetical protein